MPIDTDFHSHISKTSALEVAESAKQRGIRVLGLSEHVFQMTEGRPPLDYMPMEGQMYTFSGYIDAVQAAAESTGLDIRLGLEVDFLPAKNDIIQASIQGYPWDFLIGSVHETDGNLFEYAKDLTRERGEQLWLRYMQLLREAVNSGFFSVISHPVRMGVRNPHTPANLDEELEHLAAEATRNDIALELNGFDMRTHPGLVRRLLKACVLQKTPISVGSDAHWPREIARSHEPTMSLLDEAGIRSIRIWRALKPEEASITAL